MHALYAGNDMYTKRWPTSYIDENAQSQSKNDGRQIWIEMDFG